MKNSVHKKLCISVLSIVSLYFILICFITFSHSNYQSELKHCPNQFHPSINSDSALLKDSFEDGDQRFDLFYDQKNYFIVWSKKSIWTFGRYRVIGGSYPDDATGKKLNEFEKLDSAGFVYILYGNPVQGPIQLKISKDSGATVSQSFLNDKNHTFVVYTDKEDCNILPEPRVLKQLT
jgi:hypothetical protein